MKISAITSISLKEQEDLSLNFNSTNNYFNLSKSQKERINNKIKKFLEQLNRKFNKIHLKIKKFELTEFTENNNDNDNNNNNSNNRNISFINNEKNFIRLGETIEVQVPLRKALFIKDHNAFSDKKYHIIQKELNRDLPTLSEIVKLRNNINNTISIVGECKWYFLDVRTKITRHIFHYLKGCDNQQLDNLKEIRIKLASDGTKCGKSFFIINFTFTIINNEKTACSVFGHITLGIAQVKEEYDSIKNPIMFLMSSISSLNSIEFNNKTYNIIYFYGADYANLLTCSGLFNATSSFPCVWCECKKENLHLIAENTKRTEQMQNSVLNNQKKDEHFGYKHKSLLAHIPYSRCMIDTLHLRIRVVHVLIKLLVKDMSLIDKYDGKLVINESHTYLTNWIIFLQNNCKISGIKAIPFNSKNSAGITRDFTGSEIIKIMGNIEIEKICPGIKKNDEIGRAKIVQKLWNIFYEIDRQVSENTLTSEDLRKKSSEWLDIFISLYSSIHVTPYIHSFCNHLHEFIKEYGNISIFNEQGLEKLNDFSTKEYFNATNKKNTFKSSSLKQLLLKRERVDYYKYENIIMNNDITYGYCNKKKLNSEADNNAKRFKSDQNIHDKPSVIDNCQIYQTEVDLFCASTRKTSNIALNRLQSNSKICDEVVENYMRLISNNETLILPTIWANRIFLTGTCKMLDKKNLLKYKSIVGPICNNDHWTMFYVSLENKSFSYFDPFYTNNDDLEGFIKWTEFSYQHDQLKNCSWQLKKYNYTKQTDSLSCGVFICKYFQMIQKKIKNLIINETIEALRENMYACLTTNV